MSIEAILGSLPELQCRSIDCDKPAEFRTHLAEYVPNRLDIERAKKATPSAKIPEWEGLFCKVHLLRVLELQVDEVGFRRPMRIERVARF